MIRKIFYLTVSFLFLSYSWCVVYGEDFKKATESRTVYQPGEWQALRGGLLRCAHKFQKEKRGCVAFLGGSITEGGAWREMVCEEIKRRFPLTKFTFLNAGISSTGSTPGAFRLTTDVFSENFTPDLLFQESAVNDSTNFRSEAEILRGVEGIIRHARELNVNIDIIQLYFADPEKIQDYNRGVTPLVITQHESVARHYGNPSINLALEVTQRIQAREFTWKDDFKDLHPSLFGHELYRNAVIRLFNMAWGDTVPAKDILEPGAGRELPDPLDPFSYYRGRYIHLKNAQGRGLWTYTENWKPVMHAGTRKGFINVPAWECVKPAGNDTDILTLSFMGTAVGVFLAAGPDAGILEFRIDGGDWTQRDTFTPWSRNLYIPWAHVLHAQLTPGKHTLELRVSQEKNKFSKGHAVRIIHFLAN